MRFYGNIHTKTDTRSANGRYAQDLSIWMQKRSWESEKNNHNHDPEHLVHVPVVDHICVGADWNGEVEK